VQIRSSMVLQRACQRANWPRHIFECSPKKPINTAYYLARAIYADFLPDDPQTLEDYGFNRASTADNRTMLLGLYQGLIKYNEVEPKVMHRWRVKGILVEEIKAAYEKMPEQARGSYYPWFLRNQWIIDRKLPLPTVPTNAAHAMLLHAWEYACGLVLGLDHICGCMKLYRMQPPNSILVW
jgi:hypothetical protein